MTPNAKAALVTLGGNRFVDCGAIMAVNGAPILGFQVAGGPPLVSLSVTEPTAAEGVLIDENVVRSGHATVAVEGSTVTVRLREHVLLRATATGDNVDVQFFDLRPVGISVRADASVLHLGGAKVANKVFRGNKIAIFLGPKAAAG